MKSAATSRHCTARAVGPRRLAIVRASDPKTDATKDRILSDINQIHQQTVEAVKTLNAKRYRIEEIRTAMVSVLQKSFQELVDLEVESLKKLAIEIDEATPHSSSASASASSPKGPSSSTVIVEATDIFEAHDPNNSKDAEDDAAGSVFVNKI